MNCMKCGLEIEEGQVFCSGCLEVAEKYPVKPGIAIQLPGRKAAPSVKKSYTKRRQPPTAEEQLLKLKKRMKVLMILWFITLCLLAATVYPTVKYFTGQSFLLPGQNYTTITYAESADP